MIQDTQTMREKCPSTDFLFASPYFPVFRLNMEIYYQGFVFSLNKKKYAPEKTPYLEGF